MTLLYYCKVPVRADANGGWMDKCYDSIIVWYSSLGSIPGLGRGRMCEKFH